MRARFGKPSFDSALGGGVVAGFAAAAVNDTYAFGYRTLTAFDFGHPTYGSITASSIVPCVLAAAGYFALTRFTRHAAGILGAVTALVTIGSFAGAFQATLPDGSEKPPGFDALVMPMHVVVGVLAALVIPRFGPELERFRAWLAACRTPSASRGG
jgi:hypothetical protein